MTKADSKRITRIQESISACLRLIHLVFSVDRDAGVVILFCWLGKMFQDIAAVWVSSQIHTVVQQSFTGTVSREYLVPQFIKLFLARIMLSGFSIGSRRLQRASEAKIKKILRMKMTVKLLESFSSLDFATQNDPMVLEEFRSGHELISSSVISIANVAISITVCVAKIFILLSSILVQLRGKARLALVPIIGILLGVQCLILREKYKVYLNRYTNRWERKTRNHRRRNDLQFPFHDQEFRREAILLNLGPWLVSEYKKAFGGLMSRKIKPLRLQRERANNAYEMFCYLYDDVFCLGAVLLPVPISLETMNFMISVLRSLKSNLVILENELQFFLDYWIPKLQSYFNCIDMAKRKFHAKRRPLEQKEGGFDLKGENISFIYPGGPNKSTRNDNNNKVSRSNPILNNLSFHFEAGKMHAIVGDNGNGKTTLVHLISLLYDNYEGKFEINGHDAKEYDPNQVRLRMSIMFQDAAKLSHFSVRENIGIGDITTLENDPITIDKIAAQHKVDNFIKLDTVIGNLHNHNKDPDETWQAELSGGQWQKIAVARTFMRAKTADLVILDEPTAAMDIDAEVEFFQRLRESRKGKTTIFITHKYITTVSADCIHFMQGGKITERGNHAQLMAKQGEYARRFMLQTQGHIKPQSGTE